MTQRRWGSSKAIDELFGEGKGKIRTAYTNDQEIETYRVSSVSSTTHTFATDIRFATVENKNIYCGIKVSVNSGDNYVIPPASVLEIEADNINTLTLISDLVPATCIVVGG